MSWKRLLILGAVSIAAAIVSGCANYVVTEGQSQTAKPNINGIWYRYPSPYGEFDEESFLESDPPPPGGTPNLKEPFASQWEARRKKRAAAFKAGTPLVDPSTLCLPEGMPTIMGAIYPIEILQTPRQVTVLAEFLSQTRRIYMGKTPPAMDDVDPSYNGYSVGQWEGDTLVVETTGIREDVLFFEMPHSSKMKITERIRLSGADSLENLVVIEDPDFLIEPYSFTYGYKREEPDYEITEYICDNNQSYIDMDGSVQMRLE